jgi:TPR repeat protein
MVKKKEKLHMKKLLIIGLCLLTAGCGSSMSGMNSDFTKGGYASSNSDPYNMGMRYLLGQGVPKDESKAYHYLSKAASHGNPYAENELAYLYVSGSGVQKNNDQALYWYQKAADHGLASAQYNLGLMYLNGIGTPVDKAKAAKLFKMSADRGFPLASQALAQLKS